MFSQYLTQLKLRHIKVILLFIMLKLGTNITLISLHLSENLSIVRTSYKWTN